MYILEFRLYSFRLSGSLILACLHRCWLVQATRIIDPRAWHIVTVIKMRPTLRLSTQLEWDTFLNRPHVLPTDPTVEQLSEEWATVTNMIVENHWNTRCLECWNITIRSCEGDCHRIAKTKKRRILKSTSSTNVVNYF